MSRKGEVGGCTCALPDSMVVSRVGLEKPLVGWLEPGGPFLLHEWLRKQPSCLVWPPFLAVKQFIWAVLAESHDSCAHAAIVYTFVTLNTPTHQGEV